MLRLFVMFLLLLAVCAVPACAFKLDAEKFSASGQSVEAKPKQRPAVTAARADVYVVKPVYA